MQRSKILTKQQTKPSRITVNRQNMTKIHKESLLNLTSEQISKIIEIGGDTIIGDMLDENFSTDVNKCNKFYIYKGAEYIATVDSNINVIC